MDNDEIYQFWYDAGQELAFGMNKTIREGVDKYENQEEFVFDHTAFFDGLRDNLIMDEEND